MKVAWSVITSETQLGWESRDQPAPTERCESTARFLILSTASEAQLPSTDTVCVQTHTHSVCIDSVCVYRDPVCCRTGPVVPVVPASELQDGVYLRTTEIHWKLEDKISGKRWAETRWIYLSPSDFWLMEALISALIDFNHLHNEHYYGVKSSSVRWYPVISD